MNWFPKQNSYHSMKHQKKKDFLATKQIKKMPDATNAFTILSIPF